VSKLDFAVCTRKEAFEQGFIRYTTGKKCVRGHLSYRYTSTGACAACNYDSAKKYSTGLTKKRIEKALGYFSYPIHQDDQAAALAYCQALDMARGRTPHVPPPPMPTGAELAAQATIEIAQIRAERKREEMLRQLELERNPPRHIPTEMRQYE